VLALRKDGTVYAWGSSGTSSRKIPKSLGVATGPVRIAGLENIVQVAAARDHNLVLTRDGGRVRLGRKTRVPSLASRQPSIEAPGLFKVRGPWTHGFNRGERIQGSGPIRRCARTMARMVVGWAINRRPWGTA